MFYRILLPLSGWMTKPDGGRSIIKFPHTFTRLHGVAFQERAILLVTIVVNSRLKITVFYNAWSDLCCVMLVASCRFVFGAFRRETRLKNRDSPLYKARTRFLHELCSIRHFFVQMQFRYCHTPLTTETIALYYTQLVKKRSLSWSKDNGKFVCVRGEGVLEWRCTSTNS